MSATEKIPWDEGLDRFGIGASELSVTVTSRAASVRLVGEDISTTFHAPACYPTESLGGVEGGWSLGLPEPMKGRWFITATFIPEGR